MASASISDLNNDPAALGFTPAQVARAEELGIDLGLLAENRALTPEQRADQHDALLAQIEELQTNVVFLDRETDGD